MWCGTLESVWWTTTQKAVVRGLDAHHNKLEPWGLLDLHYIVYLGLGLPAGPVPKNQKRRFKLSGVRPLLDSILVFYFLCPAGEVVSRLVKILIFFFASISTKYMPRC